MQKNRLHYIIKKCHDCGNEFEIATTVGNRCVRCKPCRVIQERKVQQELRSKREHKRRDGYSQEMPYRIICDPDNTWSPGRDTRLALSDIECILRQGYFTPGTILKHKER